MIWVLGVPAAFLLLLGIGVLHLTTRYTYTKASRRALAGVVVVSLALAYWLARRYLAPDSPWFWPLVLGLGASLFVLLAVAVVESWRLCKQREFDRQIAVLRAREYDLLEEITVLSDRVAVESAASRNLQAAQEQRYEKKLRSYVDEWQRAGGAARIRAVKVKDWEREFEGMGVQELKERRTRLQEQLKELPATPDEEEKRRQILAQLDLLEYFLHHKEAPAAPRRPQAASSLSELVRERQEKEAELEAVRRELAAWEQRKAEFLNRRIELGS